MKKVIVTGATGFIGRCLVKKLVEENIEVIGVVRKHSGNISLIDGASVHIVECNLQDYNTLHNIITEKGIDTIFHTAWQGVSGENIKSQELQMENVKATLDLIDVAYQMGVSTFVGCGSIHERECLHEMKSDKPLTDLTFMYKVSKMAAHWMGKAKAGKYGIRFFWPLIINAYGEGEYSSRLINTLIRKIISGESMELSSGTQFYDFVHVSDVVSAMLLIGEKGIEGREYTIGSGNPKPLKEYLTIAGSVANSFREDKTEIPLLFGKITDNVISLPVQEFDISSLREDTGYKAQVSFEDGMTRTAKWIAENLK